MGILPGLAGGTGRVWRCRPPGRAAVLVVTIVAVVGVTVLTGVSASAGTHLAGNAPAFAAGGGWGTAQEVPGTGALNKDGGAGVDAVSCASVGNCSAGGGYRDGSGHFQAFVVSEVHGVWHNAEEVPGTAALNKGGHALIGVVSCVSAGNCSAGGYYLGASGYYHSFVVSQAHGSWHTAEEVPGTALAEGVDNGFPGITTMSCRSAGNCSAGAEYYVGSSHFQAYVLSQVNGTWHKIEEVPGTGALNQGLNADTTSVSCGAAGNCSAVGDYTDASGDMQVFVADETHGIWGKAAEVPATATLNKGSAFFFASGVSCTSDGTCSAGGDYTDASGNQQAFVASEVNGTWHNAEEVPGTATLDQGGFAYTYAVSCASAGNCSAGGDYASSSGGQAFVASEVNGTWHNAEEVPGTATLNKGGNDGISTMSCGAARSCSAGGEYTDGSGNQQEFVVDQVNGTWQKAEEVPGTATLNKGGSAFFASVSCASAGRCSGGGQYTDSSGREQASVINRT